MEISHKQQSQRYASTRMKNHSVCALYAGIVTVIQYFCHVVISPHVMVVHQRRLSVEGSVQCAVLQWLILIKSFMVTSISMKCEDGDRNV